MRSLPSADARVVSLSCEPRHGGWCAARIRDFAPSSYLSLSLLQKAAIGDAASNCVAVPSIDRLRTTSVERVDGCHGRYLGDRPTLGVDVCGYAHMSAV